MPHISVKMLKGRTQQQKIDLADALEKAISETLGCSSSHVTVAIEDYTALEWQDVFREEIEEKEDKLYKKAQYDPKSLL
jgi:4-oxalocrotonate tautomerase